MGNTGWTSPSPLPVPDSIPLGSSIPPTFRSKAHTPNPSRSAASARPPSYDLHLNERMRGVLLHKTVPVKTGLVLKENEAVNLSIQ